MSPLFPVHSEAVASLLRLLAAREPSIHQHGLRVGRFARSVGQAFGLAEAALARLELAGQFHDLGKLLVPSFLVRKPAAFNVQEYRIMQRHVLLGARWLREDPFLRDLAPVAAHHHERWDGRGYPSHLGGSAIPLAARIVTVADAYDALTSNRFAGNRTPEEARKEILRCRGSHFCPEVVDAFLDSDLGARMAS
jgi:HD-GYP domain-containing protein (c-di-GMP phosphodiesterase class II)